MTLDELFEKYEDEYGHHERIESPMHRRSDICAFLMLAHIQPSRKGDIVGCAEHDEIWLDANCETLAEDASEEQIRDLIRCGVRYDDSVDSLCMFV